MSADRPSSPRWPRPIRYQVLGIGFEIAGPAHLVREARRWLPPGGGLVSGGALSCRYELHAAAERPVRVLDRQYLLLADGRLIGRSPNAGPIFEALEESAAQLLAARARNRVFVHAGAVAFAGKAILLAGGRGSGKTTLTVALGRLGAQVLSDEFAVLDRRGQVHPFARPFSFKSARGRPPLRTAPTTLGLSVAQEHFPVALAVFASFRRGANFRSWALSPGRAALALTGHAFGLERRPRLVLGVAHATLLEARGFRVQRGEAHRAAERILGLLGGSSGE